MTGRAIAVVAMLAAAAPQAVPPEFRISRPGPGDRVAGDVVLAVEVPPGRKVARIDFFVDGVSACRASSAPFECRWDAGPTVAARTVRAVATLADGGTLVATLRTAASKASFRSTSDVILIPTRVTDRRGRALAGLSRQDFRVREDGVDQEITLFEPQDAPCSIFLMLDTSGSMTPHMNALTSAVRTFLNRTRPQDAVTVAGFDTALHVVAPRSLDAARRLAAVDRLRAGGGTALYDAIANAAALLKEQPAPRALVMFTDGDDVSSRASPETSRLALQDADAVLYFVGQGRAAEERESRRRLEDLAVGTGGEAFFTSNMSSVAEHLLHILEQASTQYLLGYAPQKPVGDGGWRTIDVALLKKDVAKRADVRTRAGYFATPRAK